MISVRNAAPTIEGERGTWNYSREGGTGRLGACVFCPRCGQIVVVSPDQIEKQLGEAITKQVTCPCGLVDRLRLVGWDY